MLLKKSTIIPKREHMKHKDPEKVESHIAVLLARKDFTGETLAGENLQGVDFRGCLMGCVILDDADLTGANMEGCDLYWGVLFDANFTNVNLAHAKLNGAHAEGANFTNSNLCGADFGRDGLGYSTRLNGANFNNATYDDSTVFPENFDPISHGMIRKNRPSPD